jgi:hypothetical protein
MGWGTRIVIGLGTTGIALASTGCAAVFRDSKAPVRIESDPPGANVTAKEGTGVAPLELPVPRSGISELHVTMAGFDEHHALVRKHVNGWWLTADLGTCIIPVLLCVPLLVDAISGAWNDVEPRYRAHLVPLGTGGVPSYGPDGSYYVLRPSTPSARRRPAPRIRRGSSSRRRRAGRRPSRDSSSRRGSSMRRPISCTSPSAWSSSASWSRRRRATRR